MVAESTLGKPRTQRPPRTFDPSQAAHLSTPADAPGWDVGPERRIDDGRTLTRLLGWASIGLGAVEVLAPHRLAGLLGVDGRGAHLIRAYGLREIVQGVVILNARDPEPGVWARLVGDALDIGTLGVALADEDANPGPVAGAMAMVASITALDVLCAMQLRSQPD